MINLHKNYPLYTSTIFKVFVFYFLGTRQKEEED